MKSQMSDEQVVEAERSMRGDQQAQQEQMKQYKAQQQQLVRLGIETEEGREVDSPHPPTFHTHSCTPPTTHTSTWKLARADEGCLGSSGGNDG